MDDQKINKLIENLELNIEADQITNLDQTLKTLDLNLDENIRQTLIMLAVAQQKIFTRSTFGSGFDDPDFILELKRKILKDERKRKLEQINKLSNDNEKEKDNG